MGNPASENLLTIGALWRRAHKRIGRLDRVNQVVEMFWKRPLRGPDEVSTIFVLEDGVLGVEQTLRGSNVNVNVDPIFCRAVIEFTDAIADQPFVNKIEGFL
jgi:hypothetical protein